MLFLDVTLLALELLGTNANEDTINCSDLDRQLAFLNSATKQSGHSEPHHSENEAELEFYQPSKILPVFTFPVCSRDYSAFATSRPRADASSSRRVSLQSPGTAPQSDE